MRMSAQCTSIGFIAGLIIVGSLHYAPCAQDSTGSRSVVELTDAVRIGSNLVIRENERCNSAVAILGDSRIEGVVRDDAVVIGGTLRVNGTVEGQAVVIGGSLIVSPTAQIRNGIVVIGGSSQVSDDAIVRGERVEIGAFLGGFFAGLNDWVACCLLKGRLISPSLPWTVFGFGGVLLLALVLAALFQAVYTKGSKLTAGKPGIVLLAGLLFYIAIPPASFLLAVTIVGAPLIPVFYLATFGLALIGLFSVLSHVGNQIIYGVTKKTDMPLLLGGIIGSVLFTLLAMIPVIGLLAVAAVKVLGAGAGVYAIIELIKTSYSKTNKPVTPVAVQVPERKILESGSQPESSQEAQAATEQVHEVPRLAGLWERLGAAAIDILLILIVYGITIEPLHVILSGLFKALPFLSWQIDNDFQALFFLVYLVVMWSWKGTTIGNAIFHLRVQQIGGAGMTSGVSIIRALGLVLSVLPLGLGFFWIGWDSRRQAWHDKIAGTEVVRMPAHINLLK